MYDFVILVHYLLSSIFFIVALIMITWAIIGWAQGKQYKPAFKRLSFFFTLFLYLELLTGIFLYIYLKYEIHTSGMSLEQAVRQSNIKFWVIEHVSLMLFALLLSQIGMLFIKQITSDRKKFRAATFYFGISFIVVLISGIMALFR
ncbi:MAG: hypothetical protein KAS71_16995 [Bacteroidales bacterium]|nr:hypothetical protein [Bacteroidales bacterium]